MTENRTRRYAAALAVVIVLTAHHDAERILNERFAHGEIDEQEFTAKRTALRSKE